MKDVNVAQIMLVQPRCDRNSAVARWEQTELGIETERICSTIPVTVIESGRITPPLVITII